MEVLMEKDGKGSRELVFLVARFDYVVASRIQTVSNCQDCQPLDMALKHLNFVARKI